MATTVIGISDDITTCEACGKSNLKRTVVLDVDGEIRYFGCDCAGMALMGRKSASNTKIVTHHAEAMSTAKRLLESGMSVEQMASRVFNIFGYSCRVRSDVLEFAFGSVAL